MIARRTQKGNIKITLSVEDARNLNEEHNDIRGFPLGGTRHYDALMGWRHKLGDGDSGVLKPILEGALLDASNSLVHAIYASTKPGTKAFWPDQAYHLARRAHRYARILEVMS